MRVLKFFFALWLFLGVSDSAWAEEVINRLDVDITIDPSGELLVREDISVVAERKNIRHGIYREFPTDYRERSGRPIRAEFEIVSVKRDGSPEPYFTKRQGNGVRAYLGREDLLVSVGLHHYSITFKTDRQIGFFDKHDELYFNAIGTGWTFGIQASTVRVHLPGPSQKLASFAFTGYQGSTNSQYRVMREGENSVRFDLTAPLQAHEGFTIGLQFDKGLVLAPSGTQRFRYLFRDYGVFGLALILVPIALLTLFGRWQRFGKDDLTTIVPQFYPPKDLSPAAARYILKMGWDEKIVASVFVSLAERKQIKIDRLDGWFSDSYKITKISQGGSAAALSEEERFTLELLPDEIDVTRSNWEEFQQISKSVKNVLRSSYKDRYFKSNLGQIALGAFFPGLACLFVILVLSGLSGVLTFVTLGGTVTCAVLIFVSWGIYASIMSAPTREGKPIIEQINGFKSYLSTADRARLNLLNAPGESLELFERYLPYAIALDVANDWCDRFSTLLDQAEVMTGRSHLPYYHSFANDTGSITHFASSFSAQIASSSTSPGSSSGSGGSSGGGGGGGGGGGW